LSFSINNLGERNDKYPPLLKTKLYKDSNYKYNSKFYNSSKEKIAVDAYNNNDTIPKGCSSIPIVECGGLWCVSDKLYFTWIPIQLMVFKNDHSLQECAFVDVGDVVDTPEDSPDENTEVVYNGDLIRLDTADDENDPLEDIIPAVSEIKVSTKRSRSKKV
jgi:hypothetical protein